MTRYPQKWLLLPILATLPAHAQWTSTLCPGTTLSASDFQAKELFNRHGTDGIPGDETMSEPVQMDVRAIYKSGVYDHTDIIFVERLGNLKWYDGTAKTVSLMGHIDVHASPSKMEDDNGLMGVAFDPKFETNRWIYLWYSPSQTYNQPMTGTGKNRQLRLSRFTIPAAASCRKPTAP